MFATVVVLEDGRVLIAGGSDGTAPLDSAELYDPGSATFVPAGAMATAGLMRQAVLLSDGAALFAGGSGFAEALASAELYDPATGTFAATGQMSEGRLGHGASALPGGDVLITGGGGAEDTTDVEAFRTLAASAER